MSPESQHQDSYRFGHYELRPKRRELLGEGQPIELQPRVFDLLAFLLAHRDRVVTKDELLEAVWPGVVVTDASLARAVMKARRALGDDAERQHSIKTVHGYGYRFVATLKPVPSASVAPASPAAPLTPSTKLPDSRSSAAPAAATLSLTRRFPSAALVAALVIVAALLTVTLHTPQRATESTSTRVAILPVTNSTGERDMDWVSYGLMDMLAGELRRVGGIQVIASSDVIQVIEKPALTASDNSIHPALYSRLGASHVVSARLLRAGEFYRVEARIAKASGKVRQVAFLGSDPLSLVAQFRRAMAASLPQTNTVDMAAPLISGDVFVNEAYARGRDQMLRGNLDQAYTILKAAVGEEPENFWARQALAKTQLNLGEAEAAAAIFEQLVQEARQKNLKQEEAEALFSLGTTYLRRDQHDTAAPLYETAAELFDTLGLQYQRAQVLTNLAIIVGERQAYIEERALLEQAMAAYAEAGVESVPGHIFGGLANNALDRGQLDEAEQYFEQALHAFETERLPEPKSVALFSLSRVAEYRGEFATAEVLAQESLDLAKEVGHRWGEISSLRRLGAARFARGNLAGAEAVSEEALALARELDASTSVASTLNALSEIARLRGRLTEAHRLLSEAEHIVDTTGDNIGVLWVGVQRGWLSLAQGDTAAASQSALAVLSAEDLLVPHLAADTYTLQARVLRYSGQQEAAYAALEAAYRAAEQGSDRVRRAAAAAALGRRELQRGREKFAMAYLALAQESAPEVYEVSALAGAMAANQSDWEKASVLLNEARRTAGERWTDEEEAFARRALAAAPATRE